MIWLLAVTGIAITLGWILAPFFEHRTIYWVDSRLPHFAKRRALKEDKAKCIVALRELDFDFETGKLSKDDYKQLRDKYERRAIEVMRQQDELASRWKVAERKIQEELQRLSPVTTPPSSTTSSSSSSCPSCQAIVSVFDKFCGKCGGNLSAFCPQCGSQTLSDDRFCAKCGHSLEKAP